MGILKTPHELHHKFRSYLTVELLFQTDVSHYQHKRKEVSRQTVIWRGGEKGGKDEEGRQLISKIKQKTLQLIKLYTNSVFPGGISTHGI